MIIHMQRTRNTLKELADAFAAKESSADSATRDPQKQFSRLQGENDAAISAAEL